MRPPQSFSSVHVHMPIYVDSPSNSSTHFDDEALSNCTARLAGVVASMFVNKTGASMTSGLSP